MAFRSRRIPVTVRLCFCACPDPDTAHRLARALVDARLAACVQCLPGVTSIYRWQGRIEHAHETVVLAKTTADRFDALAARIEQLHPYELPEVIAIDASDGLPAYLDWIARETAAGDDA